MLGVQPLPMQYWVEATPDVASDEVSVTEVADGESDVLGETESTLRATECASSWLPAASRERYSTVSSPCVEIGTGAE